MSIQFTGLPDFKHEAAMECILANACTSFSCLWIWPATLRAACVTTGARGNSTRTRHESTFHLRPCHTASAKAGSRRCNFSSE